MKLFKKKNKIQLKPPKETMAVVKNTDEQSKYQVYTMPVHHNVNSEPNYYNNFENSYYDFVKQNLSMITLE
jgi:hypothetical protein